MTSSLLSSIGPLDDLEVSEDKVNWNMLKVTGDMLDIIFYCHMTVLVIALSAAHINRFRQRELNHDLRHQAVVVLNYCSIKHCNMLNI